MSDKVMIMKRDGRAHLLLDLKTERLFMPLTEKTEDVPDFFKEDEGYRLSAKVDLEERIWVPVERVIDYILNEWPGDIQMQDALKVIIQEQEMIMTEWHRKKKELELQDTH